MEGTCSFDLIVIGSGPGGYVAAIRAAQLGMNTAVVERSSLGGVCLNWGCIPTKALLKSAQAFSYAGRGSEFGFSADNVKADLQAMILRSRDVSSAMNKGVEFLFKKNKITVFHGNGSLMPGKRVSVVAEDGTSQLLEAPKIILATGSHAAELPFAPVDHISVWDYHDALVPQSLPSSLAVIGSGAIGSEFAYFYRTLGVEVTLIEYLDRILPLEDEDISAQISRSFRKKGMKVMTSSAVKSIESSSEGCALTVETSKGIETVNAEKVLSAVGVRPNTEGVGLENAGVELVKGKVKVDSNYMTNVDGIYAIGDIIPTQALAHVASAEAVCCVERIAGIDSPSVDYDNIPACTYVSPEVASVGMTEHCAREKGVEYKVGKFPYTASGKAVASGNRDGFVKLIVDASNDKVLGAHLVGDGVSEMIGGIVTARNLGVTASRLIKSVFPHPTMSEAIMESAAASHNESVHI